MAAFFNTFLPDKQGDFVVFLDVEAVLGRVGDSPAGIATEILIHPSSVVIAGIGSAGLELLCVARVGAVKAELRLDGKSLHGCELDESRTRDAGLTDGAGTVVVQSLKVVSTHRFEVFKLFAILVVGIVVGLKHQATQNGIVPNIQATLGSVGVYVTLVIVQTEVQAILQPVECLRFKIGAHRDSLEAGIRCQAFTLQVGSRRVVRSTLGTAANAEIRVVDGGTVLVEILHPVRGESFVLILCVLLSGDDAIEELVVQKFVGTHGVAHAASQLAPTDTLADVDSSLFATVSFFRGDIDNAVSSAGTIDGGCRCIAQDVVAFNIVLVHHVEYGSIYRLTVNDVERRIAAIQRADATHRGGDTAYRANVTGAGENLHTSHLTLQGIKSCRNRFVLNLF